MSPPFPVLYEDNHLLAIVKPAGIPTMGVAPERQSILEMARQYVRTKFNKPGNVYLGIVSRLDAPVSGVLLLARTSKAAARLSELFRTQSIEKAYWAVIEGQIQPPAGNLRDWLLHDERHRQMKIAPPGTAHAKEARLEYRTLSNARGQSLLEVTLQTGRKHQIRVQLSHSGHPVVGDRKYGSREPFRAGIALHARRLALIHPVRNMRLELVAPLPPAWRKLGLEFPE